MSVATQSQTASLAHIMKSSYDAPRLLVSNFLGKLLSQQQSPGAKCTPGSKLIICLTADEMSASFSWIEADIKRCMQHLEVSVGSIIIAVTNKIDANG